MDDNILDSFVSYRSYHESLKELPIEQYGRLMFAINEFALYGKEPQFTNPMDKALWVAISTGVRHSREISITRSKASKLRKFFGGGAPINNNNAAKPEQNNNKTTTKQQQNNNKAEQNNNEGRREKGEGRREKGNDSSLSSESSASGNADELSFDNFWEAYNYKKGKKNALSAWNRLSKKDRQAALDGITPYMNDCKVCDRSVRHPATYLNGRTWEDEFSVSDGKEQQPAIDEFPAGMDAEKWKQAHDWMSKFTPRIMPDIDPDLFLTLRAIAHRKVGVFMEIMEEIDKSGFTGNYKEEFQRLACTEKYYQRIWK